MPASRKDVLPNYLLAPLTPLRPLPMFIGSNINWQESHHASDPIYTDPCSRPPPKPRPDPDHGPDPGPGHWLHPGARSWRRYGERRATPRGELPPPPMAQDLGQMVQAQGTQIQNPQAQANQGRREDVSQARPGTTKVLPEPSSRHRRDWSPIGTRPQPHHHPPCCRCRRTASVTPTSPTTLSS